MKAEFLSVATHELKSPIASIKCSVDLLRMQAGDDLPEDASRLLEQAGSQAELLARHVDRFLDLSRIEAGRLPIEPQPLPAAAFFVTEVDGFREAARRDGVALELEVDPAVPSEMRADPDRIGEVVRNLLENALRFTPEGGRVRVRVAPQSGGTLRVEVRDTGPGVGPGEAERVFEKYFRGSGKAARGARGSGLGLAVARGIVEAHGGRIWCEPSVGGGGRFVFQLPISGPGGPREATA
jgi:signal transduction histidine kinase